MKITNKPASKGLSQTPKKIQFEGWAAAPIKELHIQPGNGPSFLPFIHELNSKCKDYFKIVVQLADGLVVDMKKIKLDEYKKIKGSTELFWGQDNKIFFENDKLGIFSESKDPITASMFAKKLRIKTEIIKLETQGGNCFLGKKPNGETYALVGKDALDGNDKITVAKSLNVKVENLHLISQPNFHLDMVVRPLTYPYVLVGDPKLTAEIVKKGLNQNQCENFDIKYFKTIGREYASTNQTVNELKSHGFEPILVPGLIAGRRGVNFMNAIVHQKPDGKLVYITNKTNIGLNDGINFKKIFENDVRSKCPQIDKFIYIDGKGHVQEALTRFLGGTHCMTCERPDFEKWNEILKNTK